MTGTLYECEKIDLGFFADAPIRIVSEITIPCSPESLFRCFEDADSWSRWVSVIRKVEWTSSRPFQAGTTRTIEMPGGMMAYEEFLAWDAPSHMAFRFNQFDQNFIKAFGEDYRVSDCGNDRCRLVWTVAMEPNGMPDLLRPLLKPIVAFQLKGISKALAKYMKNDGRRFCSPQGR